VCRAPHGQTAYSFIINTTRGGVGGGGGGSGRCGSAQHTLCLARPATLPAAPRAHRSRWSLRHRPAVRSTPLSPARAAPPRSLSRGPGSP